MEVILPNIDEESSLDEAFNQLDHATYYEVELQLSDIISPNFIHEFIENSETCALSTVPLDKSDVAVAILPK